MTKGQTGAPLHVLLFGANGRMGQAIRRIAPARGIEVVPVARDAPEPAAPAGDEAVIIDFSGPGGAARALDAAVALNLPFVGGTTGLGDGWEGALDQAARTIPVLWASNMSLGVAVLRRLVRDAARMLPDTYDCEIVELHHRRKEDCPSGTALTLAQAVAEGRGRSLDQETARSGRVGPRPEAAVGVFGVRGGEVFGEHTVHFLGDEDRIELTHRAGSRDLFASGALTAARWMVGRPSGRYTIDDVVGSGAPLA